jgi:hypothetical protein
VELEVCESCKFMDFLSDNHEFSMFDSLFHYQTLDLNLFFVLNLYWNFVINIIF